MKLSHQSSIKNRCAIGIDDGYFPPEKKGYTTIAGVFYKNKLPTNIHMDIIKVDGKDATKKAIEIVDNLNKNSRESETLVFLDGVTYAGFNFIDPDRLHAETGLHVIVVFYKLPRKELVYDALKKHFDDWRERWMVIGKVLDRTRVLITSRGRLDYYSTINDPGYIHDFISFYQYYARIPEPLRTADLIASEASRYLIERKKGSYR